ncbi:hypothetical protein HPB47_011347 [Ixodes persulcatus]|uniref:Uncharacterized protein n=1 Tax=Ixodes persulcatus TaxID=34615 RepID=A0AC60NWK3_IXOPE|nr:hypothetical protein HPB47_011347 [Ixodes persulcatus]
MLGKKSKKGTRTLALKMDKTKEQLANMAGDPSFLNHGCKDDVGLGSPYDIETLAPNEGMDRPFTSESIAGLPRFTPLVKLEQYAQLNQLYHAVEARRKAHGEGLKTTQRSKGIVRLAKKPLDGLPELQEQLPTREDLPAITSSKAACDKEDARQLARRVKAHLKMVECGERSETVVSYLWRSVERALPEIYERKMTSSSQICERNMRAPNGALLERSRSASGIHHYPDTPSLEGPVTPESSAAALPARLKAIEALPSTASTKGEELAAIRLALETDLRRSEDETLQLYDNQYNVTARGRALPVDWKSREYHPAEEKAEIKYDYQAKLEELLPVHPHPFTRLWTTRAGKLSSIYSQCDMDAKVDTYHRVWVCPKYQTMRTKFRPEDVASLDGWTHPPENEKQQRKLLRNLLDFLRKAQLESFI